MGIYKRKQELDQETDQENDQEKRKVFYLFLGRFLGLECVFFLFFLIAFIILSEEITLNQNISCPTLHLAFAFTHIWMFTAILTSFPTLDIYLDIGPQKVHCPIV